MKKLLSILTALLLSVNLFATHGLPIVGLTGVNTGTGITISGGSDPATCGSGPYWMQVEITCTSGGLTGTPPGTLQTTLSSGAGGAQTFNSFPWFNSLLNIPTMTAANGWSDGCVTGEQYNNIIIPFTGLCPGQTYYWAAREWVSGSNSPGPWSVQSSFVVPGVFIPLGLTLNANPASYCPPGSSTLTANSVGNCGNKTITWSTGSNANSIVVSPGVTTIYTCTLSAPCQPPVIQSVTVVVSPTLTTVLNTTNASCGLSNGSATVTSVIGGTPTYSYSWSGGQTTSSITGLPSGSYSVLVTDANGCTGTNTAVISAVGSLSNSITYTPPCFGGTNGTATSQNTGTYQWSNGQITQTATNLGVGLLTLTLTNAGCTATTSIFINQQPQLLSSITTTNVNCYGSNTGSAYTNSSGGTSPYTYTWSTGSNSQTINNLVSGTYNCISTDFNGCTVNSSANITQPTQLNLSVVTQTNPLCFGQSNGGVTVSSNGGTGTYQYSINNGLFQSSNIFTSLPANTHTVVVKDQNNCGDTVLFTLINPTQLTSLVTTTNVSCFGLCNGTIVLNPNGGTLPYTYFWNNATTQSSLTSVCSGTFSVVIKDNNLCQYVLPNLVVTQPSLLVNNTVATQTIICIGQSSTLSINPIGGTPVYFYNWSNGTNTNSVVVSPTITTTYTNSLTDNNGCQKTNTVVVVVKPVITATIVSTPSVICSSETSTLSVTPTTPGIYTYTWNNGVTTTTNVVSPTSTTNYSVTISDGCNANLTLTTSVIVNPLPPIIITTSTLTGCEPLIVTYSNLSGFNCVWNINGTNYNNCIVTQTFSTQGFYPAFLTITDNNGCSSVSGVITASVYPLPVASFTPNPTITNILTPNIQFSNTSSVGSYNWNFGDGQTSTSSYPEHSYSDTGTYVIKLIVVNQYGCSDTTFGTVHIDDIFTFYIPNSFTPNSDGNNDLFGPVVSGVDTYTMWIFDRWGEMIYTTDGGTPWNGTYKGQPVKQEVYIWKIQLIDKSKEKHDYIGHVTLIR